MKNKVIETIKKYNLIDDNDKILVGVSGGPDSMCLLHVLKSLNYDVCVAHINHGLRENANMEEEYVRDYCRLNNIPFFAKHIKLKENLNGMTIEEAGRKARYDFFAEMLEKEKCTKIATAHTSNDNAETVIMNMVRGSGVNGLKGIEPIRGNIIRPLIDVTRREIEEYCETNILKPKHDESNDELLYTRNKVRLELIPYIEKNINSNVISNINRMSKIVLEEEAYIDKKVEEAFESCLITQNDEILVCNLRMFNKLDIVIRKRLILKFIIKILGNAKDIEKVHVDDIVKLCENNVGGKYLTPNKHIKVSVGKGKIQIEKII